MRMPRYFDLSTSKPVVGGLPEVPLGGTRAQAVHRLQIGVAGVVMMVLLVGLASLVQDKARQVDAASVPEAAATTEPSAAPKQNDPLVEAGVVPDLPAEPTPTQSPAVVPEQGIGDAAPAGE